MKSIQHPVDNKQALLGSPIHSLVLILDIPLAAVFANSGSHLFFFFCLLFRETKMFQEVCCATCISRSNIQSQILSLTDFIFFILIKLILIFLFSTANLKVFHQDDICTSPKTKWCPILYG